MGMISREIIAYLNDPSEVTRESLERTLSSAIRDIERFPSHIVPPDLYYVTDTPRRECIELDIDFDLEWNDGVARIVYRTLPAQPPELAKGDRSSPADWARKIVNALDAARAHILKLYPQGYWSETGK